VRNNGRLMEADDWGRQFDRRGWPGQREYQLLVELAEIQPRIWRRLVLADTTSLTLLHRILQVAFGWQDRHLHEFKVGSVRFGVPDEDFPPPPIDERRVRLYQIAYEPGDRFVYAYDFGDSWHHDAVLEELRAAPEPPRPRCLEAGEHPLRKTAVVWKVTNGCCRHWRILRTRNTKTLDNGRAVGTQKASISISSTAVWRGCRGPGWQPQPLPRRHVDL
jgi:hypothetical protein